MTLRVAPLTGTDMVPALDALARLRIAVFRDWPYLYDGTIEYERRYLNRNAGAAGVFVPADHGFSDTGVLAEGALNRPQWVHAEVDLARLAEIEATGEMRNATDWPLQPGAAPLGQHVEVVDVT